MAPPPTIELRSKPRRIDGTVSDFMPFRKSRGRCLTTKTVASFSLLRKHELIPDPFLWVVGNQDTQVRPVVGLPTQVRFQLPCSCLIADGVRVLDHLRDSESGCTVVQKEDLG